MIYITNFANIENAKGRKVCITRYKEDWLANVPYDYDLKLLAPSEELFHDAKVVGISWNEYEERYRKQITPRRLKMILRILNEYESEAGDVTLLCYCGKDKGKHCHRFIAGDILKEAGKEVVYL